MGALGGDADAVPRLANAIAIDAPGAEGIGQQGRGQYDDFDVAIGVDAARRKPVT
ncbi:hypothetical protein D3C86_2104430 [compost metagenome]